MTKTSLERKPPVKIKITTCNACGEKVEYTASDIKVDEGKDLSGRVTSREWVDCTECGAPIIFSKQ